VEKKSFTLLGVAAAPIIAGTSATVGYIRGKKQGKPFGKKEKAAIPAAVATPFLIGGAGKITDNIVKNFWDKWNKSNIKGNPYQQKFFKKLHRYGTIGRGVANIAIPTALIGGGYSIGKAVAAVRKKYPINKNKNTEKFEKKLSYYKEIYQTAFEDEIEKIAQSGFGNIIKQHGRKIIGTIGRKIRRLPTLIGAKAERFKRYQMHSAAAKAAITPKAGVRRPQFAMGSPGDISYAYHTDLARKNLERTGIPSVARGVATAGGIGLAGSGAKSYFLKN